MGMFEKAEALFRDWLSVEPDWGFGWIGWSDLYWLMNLGFDKDFKKAEKILKQGLKVPNVYDRDYIEERLADMTKERRKYIRPTMPVTRDG
jgi:outer membrane receptor for Fe3+-dicitrate